MKKISDEWLKAAKDDLRVADKIIADETLTHMVAFHSQQCIEKSLKAVMEEYGIELVNKQKEKIREIREIREIRAKKIRKA